MSLQSVVENERRTDVDAYDYLFMFVSLWKRANSLVVGYGFGVG